MDYIKVAANLLRFFLTGARNEAAFHAWRALHCKTNGYSTDILNLFIEAVSNQPKFGTISGIAGNLDRSQRRKILSSVERDGIFIFPDRVSPDVVTRLREFAFANPSDAFPLVPDRATEGIFNPVDPISPTCWHKPNLLIQNETVQAIISDPSLLALAAEYLKVQPHLMTINMWHSSHRWTTPTSEGAQLFHFDLSYPRWVKFFIYLSDVTQDSGPHCFVKGSHRRDRQGAALRARGIQRIPDEEVIAAYGRDRVIEVMGPAGTLIMLDTRAFHKGVKPRSSDRLMLELEYANCTYSLPYKSYQVSAKIPALAEIAHRYPKTFSRFRVFETAA